jgi:glycosyltransferase involved in cell wall biosynthesis
MYAFTLRRQEVIFTTEFERQYAIRYAPWIRTRSTVIPLGTSITPSIACGKREKHEIVHFGLIRNDKGLEEVLRLAKLIRDRRLAFRIRIVGHVYAGCQEYFEKLRSDSCYLPVTWETTLADEQVGEVLANATFAYLPFPDGASERRSSMIAALASKLVVISTRGAQTPNSLNGVVEFCQGAEDALNAIQFLSDNRESQKSFLDGAERYCQLRSWESIASQHIRLYATCGGLSENRRLEPPVTDSGQSCLR